jgi:hypothetical protein
MQTFIVPIPLVEQRQVMSVSVVATVRLRTAGHQGPNGTAYEGLTT